MKNTRKIKHTGYEKRFIASTVVVLTLITLIIPMFGFKVSAASSDQINYFGTVVPCGKDNGYKPNTTSSWNPWTMLTASGLVMGLIPDDDPHKGWTLGSFYVQGYSGTTESNLNSYEKNMPVYLKNAGDTVSFGFKLDQNINKLNGNSKYKISDDHKVIQDCWVDDPYVSGDLGKGVLIIIHRDWQGKETKTVYKDFLKGKSVGANTEVQLFEEGDYRVVLCYEIYKDDSWNWITDWMDPNGSWFNYRIESYFSVRNANSMVFPFDIESGAELTNHSYSENGFRVDLANSKYLKLSVKKEILNENGSDIIEDTRFNKVVADKAEFTEEGKYTVTVKNLYTDLVTEKIIYVGTNDVMRCNTVTGMSVQSINECLRKGYKIRRDGTLQEPESDVDVGNMSTQPTKIDSSNDLLDGVNSSISEEPKKINWAILAIAIISISIIGGAIYLNKESE